MEHKKPIQAQELYSAIRSSLTSACGGAAAGSEKSAEEKKDTSGSGGAKEYYLVVSERPFGGGRDAIRMFAAIEEAVHWVDGSLGGVDCEIYRIAEGKQPEVVTGA